MALRLRATKPVPHTHKFFVSDNDGAKELEAEFSFNVLPQTRITELCKVGNDQKALGEFLAGWKLTDLDGAPIPYDDAEARQAVFDTPQYVAGIFAAWSEFNAGRLAKN